MLADLHREREQIDEAILTLERLALGRGKRRGRPPAWLREAAAAGNANSSEANEGASGESKRRGRPPGKHTGANAAEA